MTGWYGRLTRRVFSLLRVRIGWISRAGLVSMMISVNCYRNLPFIRDQSFSYSGCWQILSHQRTLSIRPVFGWGWGTIYVCLGVEVMNHCCIYLRSVRLPTHSLWFMNRWAIRIDSWTFSFVKAFVAWIPDPTQFALIPTNRSREFHMFAISVWEQVWQKRNKICHGGQMMHI